ncbi:alpha/beta fold hydrolase [Novosphingobium sp. PC22D]|uniref:alpha/beta hydrolase family protein n=1 Tax=Novosphingobium sp. PC22D TaxID=1962403 RepID=UPI001439313B|nr:alpha/beta fold hydrolase [Novosphingobium sp. PC22D]
MMSPRSAGHLAMLVLLGCALAGCSATVDQSTLLPALDEPAAVSAVMPSGYTREERVLSLPRLGDVHVARLTGPGNNAVMLYCGGNSSFIATTSKRLGELAELTSADIIAFDYPGRGGTTIPNTTQALIAFGPAYVDALRSIGWIKSGPLFAYGFSLGGASAANVARRGGFSGIIFEATAADIAAVADNMLPPLFKPFVRIKVAESLKHFDFRGYARAAHAPILVLAGRADRTVSLKQASEFARELREDGSTVTFVEVPGGHGSALSSDNARHAIAKFVGTH